MQLLAAISDVGTNFKVVSVLKGEEDKVFEYGGVRYYRIQDISCFELIEDSLKSNKTVFIPKNLVNPLTSPDLIIQDAEDQLEAEKMSSLLQSQQFISNRMGSLSVFNFYAFVLLNNQLMFRGHVITNENREEKYLEIVNSEDERLIELLERYLELVDKLSESRTMYLQWEEFKKSLNDMTTTQDVKSLLQGFKSKFN